MIELKETMVEFNVKGRPIAFKVFHNLPKDSGLTIENAVEAWVHRTHKYKGRSLCDYIASKKTGYVCMTEAQFNKMMKTGRMKQPLKAV